MKRHISNEVLCPFYHSEDNYKICCEGVTNESTVHVVFPAPRFKTAYSKTFCCEKYKKCKVCKMLYEKYQ